MLAPPALLAVHPEAAASRAGLNASRPRLTTFLRRIHTRDAYLRALERGGAHSF
jgi:glutathione S-transferase